MLKRLLIIYVILLVGTNAFCSENELFINPAQTISTCYDEIELDEMILDNLRLNLPVRFVCKEDCKGVCTKCGKNLNFEKCECVEERKPSPFDVLKDKM